LYKKITLFLKSHEKMLLAAKQRMAVVFHGGDNNIPVDDFISELWHKRKLVISAVLENALVDKLAATKLGEEYDLVVFDARESFNPDALGVASGVLCGGGSLIIILPEFKKWQNTQSLFLKYFSNLLFNQPGVYYFKHDDYPPKYISTDTRDNLKNDLDCMENNALYSTTDQKLAVEYVINSIRGNNSFCCVLTSARGRGKSSALGLVASQMINNTTCNFLISAPRLSVADTMFFHLHKQCPQGTYQRGIFKYKNSSLKFIAPDLLLEKLPEADVLFIDEAAVIPLSMLEKLLSHYPKIIFSTTTHGYEGTGRGFILKFYKLLDAAKPDWKKLQLHQPVRWSVNDPLESWIESILFLNLKLIKKPVIPVDVTHCQVSLIDRSELIKDDLKLAQLFSLLVFAHYRTSPADFKYLLDDECVRIYSLDYQNSNLAVLVVNQEGGFDSALSTAIYRGERRPKGNLLAQTLCFHAGYEMAAEFKYARVMRIAVHPQVQQMGLGSYLLEEVIKCEKARGMDVIGCSFSATTSLLEFWNKAGLSILRFGFSRDHVSAAHSAVMAKSLTCHSQKMIDDLSVKFLQNISLWLQGALQTLSDEIKNSALLRTDDENCNAITQFDLADVESFARYNRNYDACMPAIIRYIKNFALTSVSLTEQEQQIIHLSIQYKNDWKTIVLKLHDNAHINSKAQATQLLRIALGKLSGIH